LINKLPDRRSLSAVCLRSWQRSSLPISHAIVRDDGAARGLRSCSCHAVSTLTNKRTEANANPETQRKTTNERSTLE